MQTSCVFPELTKETPKPERPAPLIVPAHGLVEEPPSPTTEEEGGIPIPTSGLLQVAERRQPLSSVSSLEVHFDLLDLTELTDICILVTDGVEMQISLCLHLHPHPNPRAGYMRSPSWTRTKGEQGREKKHLSDSELQAGKAEAFLTLEKPAEE
ncbi:hypothetical protein JD844_000658 [Phrynosoma platyrhinos]|uniref:Dysbindin domain-containing protein 1 n=1 Tax=Phrynosoma platyrhinos TaxID=52577 RepID=A0ABQ7SQW3_PHRPL|nr:hypothetical protein JD844_000658 [Phrynosoma platyrhinos]